MSWTFKGGAENHTDDIGTVSTSLAVTASAAVSVGDTVFVVVSWGTGKTATSTQVTDQLGNTYTKVFSTPDGASDQSDDLYIAKVTVSGTPIVTLQFNPTPGTSQSASLWLICDVFSGSGSLSATDGSSSNQQGAPVGTGTDAAVSGTFATATDGDLIYGFSGLDKTGFTAGTGFTNATTSTITNNVQLVMQTSYKVQSTHNATTQLTATPQDGTRHLVTGAVAVTPGASVTSDEGEVWLDVWKAAKPYVPTTTVYC